MFFYFSRFYLFSSEYSSHHYKRLLRFSLFKPGLKVLLYDRYPSTVKTLQTVLAETEAIPGVLDTLFTITYHNHCRV
jgi:hypothetical protein